MTKRMCIFVKALIHQCNKFQLPAELIMVEWNPPENTPYLKDILPQPPQNSYLTIRYIIVPNYLHKKLQFSEKLPLFQMIAKNAGIRRAKAPFVLCTNIDLLFSDDLFGQLKNQNLKKGVYYRANRCDVPETIDENLSTEDQLQFCEKNILKRLGKSNLYPNLTDTNSFLFKYWFMIPVFVLLAKLKWKLNNPINNIINAMDTDACGDFTLMCKEDWLKIKGYPELEVYSLHIDSMGLFAANAVGLKQEIFSYKACTYHINHDNGWEFNDPKKKVLFFTNKPVLDWWSVYQWGVDILKKKETFDFNTENWGLADVELTEYTA